MTSAEPSVSLTIGSLLLGIVMSVFWTVAKYPITMAHEGGHAFFGSASGGRVREIRLLASGSGSTLVPGGNNLLTGITGYLGPSICGLVGATMLAHRVSPDTILWISFAFLIVLFIQTRNFFGWFIVGLYGALFYVIARHGAPGVRAVAAYTWIWFLLLGGVLQNALSSIRTGDAVNLKELYRLPVGFWTSFWWLSNTAALIYGGGILFGLIDPPLRAPG